MSVPPAEFVGRARLLRMRLAQADERVVPAMRRVLAPLQARLDRGHRNHRPSRLIDVERAWRTSIPPFGRLRVWTRIGDRVAPRFDELRCVAATYRDTEWAAHNDEPGLAVVLNSVEIEDCCAMVDQRGPFVTLGLHALARRIERGGGDESAILSELCQLALAFPDMAPTAGQFAFSGWRGHMAEHDDGQSMASIRTFIPAEAA